MKRVFLIGYMGAGKTTLGRKLAEALQFSFVDLDLFIEERFHRSVSSLFSERGENWFRETERRLLREAADFDRVVIATGGGTPCFFDNMDYMKKQGTTVYLEADAETLARRLAAIKYTRPLLSGKSEEELLSFVEKSLTERCPVYEQAELIVPTGKMDTSESVRQAERKLVDDVLRFNRAE